MPKDFTPNGVQPVIHGQGEGDAIQPLIKVGGPSQRADEEPILRQVEVSDVEQEHECAHRCLSCEYSFDSELELLLHELAVHDEDCHQPANAEGESTRTSLE